MLDPFTSLSLVSAIIQLADFGGKLLSKGTKLYRHTALPEYVDLELIARDLNNLNANLLSASRLPLSKDEIALGQLINSSKAVSDELIAILLDIKVRKPHQKWQSFWQAIKSVRKMDKVHALEKSLDDLQANINSRLLSMLWTQESAVSRTLEDLRAQSERHEANALKRLETLRYDILHTLHAIAPAAVQSSLVEPGWLDKVYFLPVGLLTTAKQSTRASRDSEAHTILHRLLNAFITEGKEASVILHVLQSLYFEELKEREFNIKKSHALTYHWIFAEDGPFKQVKFMNWLKNGSNIFWISGKAGSGKSTLMKLISSHSQTCNALQNWADKETSVIASHFFWSGGSRLQKSQTGLLRSLLYQILRQQPALIQIVCPEHWYTDESDYFFLRRWSNEELSKAFKRLSEQELLPIKICIFVDGLDEYHGEHQDIISIFQDAGTSPNIKLCLSSRPWNVFQNAFGNSNNQMALQNYTKKDISDYVFDTLYQNPRFIRLVRQNKQAHDLRDQITDKANGVFLWVFLVVRSLLSGLTDGNSITDLQQRVFDLPEDLEEFFKLMIHNIEPFYRAQTAHILLTAIQAGRPQPLFVYSFLEDIIKDPDFALGEIQPITDTQVLPMFREYCMYLNARCKDLLEVVANVHDKDRLPASCLTYKVDFLHRTVRDFLYTRDIYDDLERKAAANFDARKALCRVHLAQIKACPPSFFKSSSLTRRSDLEALLIEILYDVYHIESFHGVAETAHMEELDRFMSKVPTDVPRSHACWTNDFFKTKTRVLSNEKTYQPVATSFFSIAVEARLRRYVAQKLDEDPRLLFQKRPRALLSIALDQNFGAYEQFDSYFDVDMVRLLLDRGANPNARSETGGTVTIWDSFLIDCLRHGSRERVKQGLSPEYKKQVFNIAQMMVEHGADVSSRGGQNHCDAGEILSRILQPQDWISLERSIEEKRTGNMGIIWRWLRSFSRNGA